MVWYHMGPSGDPTDELPASLLGQFPELADVTLAQSGTVFGVGYGGCLGSNSHWDVLKNIVFELFGVLLTTPIFFQWRHHEQSGDMQIRHINHMTMEAWYAEYLSYCESHGVGESERCSSRTFRNTYDHHWKPILKMRETSQHARPWFKNSVCFLQNPGDLNWHHFHLFPRTFHNTHLFKFHMNYVYIVMDFSKDDMISMKIIMCPEVCHMCRVHPKNWEGKVWGWTCCVAACPIPTHCKCEVA